MFHLEVMLINTLTMLGVKTEWANEEIASTLSDEGGGGRILVRLFPVHGKGGSSLEPLVAHLTAKARLGGGNSNLTLWQRNKIWQVLLKLHAKCLSKHLHRLTWFINIRHNLAFDS